MHHPSGLNEIPAWFLRISAPALAKPLSELYNISVNSSQVPNQWKSSIITPVAKINKPVNCSDFRPISITPLMSRLFEKLITREFIYPVFEHPELADKFNDQYAYKPTGSTTAAIIKIIHTVAEMLQKHPYVHVIALDFSKAFDTIRHSTLLQKCSDLPISDNVYNWLVNYLEQRNHCTKFNGETSPKTDINASVVQGSGIGPSCYVIGASDLRAKNILNIILKYADDSYLIIPSNNADTIQDELDHIAEWADTNNLKLNTSKTKELIIHRPKATHPDPPTLAGVERVHLLTILGIVFQSDLSFREHVKQVVTRCAQNIYAIRILRAHGLQGENLWSVTNSTLVSRATYASQAWWGMISMGCRERLQATFKKVIKQGLLPANHRSFSEICDTADRVLFANVLGNPCHSLHHLLPPKRQTKYDLRKRAHDREIPLTENSVMKKTFIIKMLYLNSY